MSVSSEKPDSVTIVVWNRKKKKSRSLTVYGNIDEVFAKVKKSLKS